MTDEERAEQTIEAYLEWAEENAMPWPYQGAAEITKRITAAIADARRMERERERRLVARYARLAAQGMKTPAGIDFARGTMSKSAGCDVPVEFVELMVVGLVKLMETVAEQVEAGEHQAADAIEREAGE